jgi:ureidoglycolate hydrolase
MLARSLEYWSIFDPNVKYNFIQHCYFDLALRSHFEALESVLLIFFSSTPRKNMIKLTLVPQNAYLGSQNYIPVEDSAYLAEVQNSF